MGTKWVWFGLNKLSGESSLCWAQFLMISSISRKVNSFWVILISSANFEFILTISVRVLVAFRNLVRFLWTSFLRALDSLAFLALKSLADFRFFAILDIFFRCKILETSQNSQEAWNLLGFVQNGALLPEPLRKHIWIGGGPGWPLPIRTDEPWLFKVRGPRACLLSCKLMMLKKLVVALCILQLEL